MRCIAVAAMTMDGKIALDSSHLSDWTSPEDKKFLRDFLSTADVIVVGRNTYQTAEKQLSKRNCIVMTSSVATTERKNDNLLFWNPEGVPYSSILQNYKMVAVLGGTKTYTWFLENDLLDELYLTIEPIVFGSGLPLFDRAPGKRTFQIKSSKLLNTKGTVLLHAVWE